MKTSQTKRAKRPSRFRKQSVGPASAKRNFGAQPGHQVLFADIYEKIASGAWAPDTQIPSERELCELFKVSRTMVRQALLNAERHGLIVRAAGKGTFVAHQRIQQDLDQLTSFRESLKAHSLQAGRRLLRVSWEPAPENIAQKLKLPIATPVLVVDMLGLAGQRPMAIYSSHIVPNVGPAVHAALQNGKAEVRSTYELVAQALKTDLLIADQLFEAIAADAAVAARLGLSVGSAVFRVTSVFRTAKGEPVEARVSINPGDRYLFHAIREFRLSAKTR